MCTESLPASIQELGPKEARLCLEIEKFGNLKSGTNFAKMSMLVGVSGGIDSTALLIIATLLARKSGGRVFCAHVDHGLRKESTTDRKFVENLCKRLGIPCESHKANIASYAKINSMGLEEAGRIVRYDFFKQCLKKFDADLLLLAHHVDDLSEDVIMRLLRGAGWPALGGMDAYDPARKLLRPLLSTRKNKLESFLRSINCSWCEDQSNLSDQYTRNRVRNNLIPLLLEENPNLGAGLLRLKQQADLDADFWRDQLANFFEYVENTSDGSFFVPCSILNKSHKALRVRIYKQLLDLLGSGHALSDSILQLDQGFLSQKSGSTYQFPGNKVVKISKKGLLFKVIKTIDRESGKV
ncbi:tRNA lysidine(34) synthetase TilS [Maridesulfovibrio zosterae]|uniref:tRNA lysidine(34) synthetase TilS n=1 Tax=Maridesulfovibrio zosterae TaxID=82171 RepID=UPI000427EC79|nr:tRNA lysidine(34) synthetase TilS [Maridesulfovibrio zosterae]